MGMRWSRQDGVMAGWVEAQDDGGAGRFFDAQAFGANGEAPVDANLEGGAHTPYIGPPRATWDRAQHGAIFLFGGVPSTLGGLAQFAMDFVGVAMVAECVDMSVGFRQVGNFFTGEVGRQPALPELVFAFDFALGLGCGGVTQADVVKLERPAQLGECGGIMGEKEAVIIDIKLQRAAVSQEGGGQKVKIRKQQFALVKLGAGEQTAAIVEHVEHGKGYIRTGEPAVG